MDIFERYWEEKAKYDADHPIQVAKVRVADNPNFNLAILKQNIDHVDDMTDSELRTFIQRCFKSIMRDLFGAEMPKYIKYFQKYLNNLQLIATIFKNSVFLL